MQRDLRAYLHDVLTSAEKIERFTHGLTAEAYAADEKTRLAVERCFEIIGEALVQAARNVEDMTAFVPDAKRMISFRNVLIHNYSIVNDRQVWLATQDMPRLIETIKARIEGNA